MRNALRFGFLAAYCCWVAYGLGPLRKYLEVPYQYLDVRSELKRINREPNGWTCTKAALCLSRDAGLAINPKCSGAVIFRGAGPDYSFTGDHLTYYGNETMFLMDKIFVCGVEYAFSVE